MFRPGADVGGAHLLSSVERSAARKFETGDVVVVAESALATAEGRVVRLDDVEPSREALQLAEEYEMDPRHAEVVLRESDRIVGGGIPGFLLCMKNGTLLPNAGIDASNTPGGHARPPPPLTRTRPRRVSVPRSPGGRGGRRRGGHRRRLPDARDAARMLRGGCDRVFGHPPRWSTNAGEKTSSAANLRSRRERSRTASRPPQNS
ncbi:coenzyme F420-0:L-glutamate ligase [Methanoculleus chikugoensis]|uniref:coenzyme F420-0:L-glutamate ligase n=1 Tax=Methanoculleus chikugoensis TaxID=118126 RepID=UPI001FB1B271|nr:coenzyme F420-0:L-glutamate ligase [Methanoculleus chikugoensis]